MESGLELSGESSDAARNASAKRLKVSCERDGSSIKLCNLIDFSPTFPFFRFFHFFILPSFVLNILLPQLLMVGTSPATPMFALYSLRMVLRSNGEQTASSEKSIRTMPPVEVDRLSTLDRFCRGADHKQFANSPSSHKLRQRGVVENL